MTDISKQKIGQLGEDTAVDILVRNGFSVIGRNIHVSHKEIDVIAENDTHLVFVEVKARRQDPAHPSPYGRPAEAVDYKKRKRIATAAQIYLYEHPTDKVPRIDVIEVFVSSDGAKILHTEWYQNAFGADG